MVHSNCNKRLNVLSQFCERKLQRYLPACRKKLLCPETARRLTCFHLRSTTLILIVSTFVYFSKTAVFHANHLEGDRREAYHDEESEDEEGPGMAGARRVQSSHQ